MSVHHLSQTTHPVSRCRCCDSWLFVCCLSAEGGKHLAPSLLPSLTLPFFLCHSCRLVVISALWQSPCFWQCLHVSVTTSIPHLHPPHTTPHSSPPMCKRSIHSLLLCFHSELLNYSTSEIHLLCWCLYVLLGFILCLLSEDCGWNHCHCCSVKPNSQNMTDAKSKIWQLQPQLQRNTTQPLIMLLYNLSIKTITFSTISDLIII